MTGSIDQNKPLISIITVVFNSVEFLEKTIRSVLNQTSSNYEYIIVDGKSTDGSLDIIKKYESGISKWITEPDQGLYDAMNKGMDMATGQYIWFLNAGDEIDSVDAIRNIENIASKPDVLYSDTKVFDNSNEELGLLSELTHNNAPKNLHWKNMERGMVVCHQSFLVKKSIAPRFDLRYKYSADIDWVIKCLKNSRKNEQTSFILSKYLSGGLSKQHLKASMKERYFILKKHFGFFKNLINHIYLAYRYLTTGRNSKLNQV